jgi:hypothetical protein
MFAVFPAQLSAAITSQGGGYCSPCQWGTCARAYVSQLMLFEGNTGPITFPALNYTKHLDCHTKEWTSLTWICKMRVLCPTACVVTIRTTKTSFCLVQSH